MLMPIVIMCAGILDLILAVVVWRKGRKFLLNRIFIMMAIFLAIWIFLNFLFQLTYNLSIVIHFYAVGALITSSILLFSYCFVDGKLSRKTTILIMSPGVAFFILSYINGLIIVSVEHAYTTGYDAHPGVLFPAFGIFIVTAVVLFLYKFGSKYKNFNAEKKSQAKCIMLGIASFGIFTTIVSFILPFFEIWHFTSFDTIASLFFTIGITYAITKHHLMNIKVIATEMFAFLISVMLLVDSLLSKTQGEFILKFFIFLGGSFLGALLIRGVLKDTRNQEKIKKLVDDLAKTNRKLKSANKQLLRLDEAKSEFLTIASHQLRTPLTAIKGLSSMLLEGDYGEVSRTPKRAIKKVFTSSERLNKLVENLLNISKIESGGVELNLEKMYLQNLVKEVINELMPIAKRRRLKIKIKNQKYIPKILLDKEQLRQVIMNLVDNSIKYTKKGIINVEIKLIKWKELRRRIKKSSQYNDKKLSSKNGKYVLFSVQDNGRGVLREDQLRLFQKFTRGKGMSKVHTEGSGLGLYVCRRVIEAHKGFIWVESKGLGKGTTFCFALRERK